MNEETVMQWIQKARNDLKIAIDELDCKDPTTDMVCFHFQQAAEKILKAFLIYHGKEYPKTHRLAALLALCSEFDPSFESLMEGGVDGLTQYATGMRYGESFRLPSDQETYHAMELAECVANFVMGKLAKKGFEMPRGDSNPCQRFLF